MKQVVNGARVLDMVFIKHPDVISPALPPVSPATQCRQSIVILSAAVGKFSRPLPTPCALLPRSSELARPRQLCRHSIYYQSSSCTYLTSDGDRIDLLPNSLPAGCRCATHCKGESQTPTDPCRRLPGNRTMETRMVAADTQQRRALRRDNNTYPLIGRADRWVR